MKKILTFAIVAISCNTVLAQTWPAGITITNNSNCTFKFTMYATDTVAGDYCEDLISDPIGLTAGSSFNSVNFAAFTASPGWATITNPINISDTGVGNQGFKWADVKFTASSCPMSDCMPWPSGIMDDSLNHCLRGSGLMWSFGLGCATFTGTWTTTYGGSANGYVAIVIN